MSSEYNYDAEAQFFPFFVLTITSLVTLPLTYSLLRPSKEVSDTAPRISSSFAPPHADLINGQRAKQKRKERKLKRFLTAVTGWAVIAYMVYLMVVTARQTPQIWDPYSILDVGMSATEKQIQSRYRRLSITMHPDKAVPDASRNETYESVNDRWVEIVKAYKALTDEEIRNNYIQYGNPDGKQSTSIGVALPQFLVAEGTGKYVLLFYGVLLGIGLPYLVGKWWYGLQSKTREKILVSSAGNMFQEWNDRMDAADVLNAVSSAMEYRDILTGAKADTGLGRLEKQMLAGNALLVNERKKIESLDDPVRRKTLALLYAYLTRTDLNDKDLEDEKFELAPTALQLNEAFGSICLAYGATIPVLSCYATSQALIQAVPPTNAAPLLQLPYFTPSAVRAIESTIASSSSKEHVTLQKFMAMDPFKRKGLSEKAGITSSQLSTAEAVAKQLPLLRIEKCFFKVQGEKYIIPSSLVQFVIKARFIPPGTPERDIPAINEKDFLDIDPDDTDLAAQKKESEQHSPPLVYAPYLARDRSPKWRVFLADARQGRVAVPPFTFQTFDKKPFNADGRPTFNVVTLKMQFQAPPQPGDYKFTAHVVCDSYLGFDHRQPATMVVEDASKAQEVDDDDYISEPDEDSIAGQVAALQGKPTADTNAEDERRKRMQERRRRMQAKRVQEVDSDGDEESGTDEDQESTSETDTDTDSEDEREALKKKAKGWLW